MPECSYAQRLIYTGYKINKSIRNKDRWINIDIIEGSREALEGVASGNTGPMPGFTPPVPKFGGGGGAFIIGIVVGVVVPVLGGSIPPAVLRFSESKRD